MASHSNNDFRKLSNRKNIKSKKRDYIKNLYPALCNTKNGEIYGYIDEKGNFIIEPKFDRAYDFTSKGVAIVTENGLDGLINLEGNYVIPPIYDSLSPFVEGKSIFVQNGKMGAIDEEGNVVTKNLYSIIGNFSEGRAVVGESKSNGYKYGYIDGEGREVIPLKYENADDFRDGVALVKIKENKYGLIDKHGRIISSYDYYSVSRYSEGFMTFTKGEGELYGYINMEGTEEIKPIYTMASEFNEGRAIVSTEENFNGPYGVIDTKGRYVYTTVFSEIIYLGEGMFALGMPIGKPLDDEKFTLPSIYAIGDIKGNILTTFKYLYVGKYKNGIASSSDITTTFFIDKNGKVIKSLPRVKGSGELLIKDNIVFADIDYSPYYLTRSGKIIYKPNDTITLDEQYSVIKEKYKPNYSFLIYIPQVKGIKNKRVEKKINIKLRTLSYFKPYEKEQLTHSIDENDVLDYSYYGNFSIVFYKRGILILSLMGYYYPLGAAHGLSSKITPVINLETGEFYKIEDLFKKDSEWKNRLDSIIQNMIEKDQQYEYVYKDGFKGIKEGQNFYFDEDNLYIYFQPYDIGPYAAGFITFKIPLKLISDIIETKIIN